MSLAAQQVDPSRPMLPQAIIPLLVEGVGRMVEHSGRDGRLMVQPGQFAEGNWYNLSAVAVAFVTQGTEHYQDGQVADLLRMAGHRLAATFAEPGEVNLDGWWYEEHRPNEWIVESWLLAYELLKRAGADDLVAGWKETLLRVAAVYDRYCRQVEHLRRMTSPNLKISTNHFAYFAADLLRLGQVFGVQEYVARGLAVARRIAGHQHPDGYWPETHGPTTSYNQITVGAMGLCASYTGEAIFERALRRAMDFHGRFSYPDGVCVETIDQRVRYPSPDGVFAWPAVSRWPDGRGWAELQFARAYPRWRQDISRCPLGRLAICYVRYQPGPVEPPECCQPARQARLSDQPAGLAGKEGWVVALSGIPSRPRNHHYTLDRQNLLSIWHERCGLIIGGGNNRDSHDSATFHARMMNDPAAVVHGITHEDAYVPVTAILELGPEGGTLDLEYQGFDATLMVRIADRQTCQVTAFTGTLPVNDPIMFSPHVLVDSARPIDTGTGRPLATGQESWTVDGSRLGGWFGQGNWRIEVPPEARLSYPLIPYRPNPAAQPQQRLALLTAPVTNRAVELIVRVTE